MAHQPKIFDFTGIGGSSAIENKEIAFGTGTGLTSSNFFCWDESRVNLLASTSSNFGKANCTYRSAIIGGKNNCIDYGNDSAIIGGYKNQILSNTQSSFIIGGRCSIINNSDNSSIINGWCNCITGTGSFMNITNSIFSKITSNGPYYGSVGASIFGGSNHTIGTNSEFSFILGGNCNEIFSSVSSVIIGGEFLCLTEENKIVLVPQLKIDVADTFQEGSSVLIWDNDKYVRRRTIASLAASMSVAAVAINSTQVSFGNSTSTGITSSNFFTYDNQNDNLLVSSTQSAFLPDFNNTVRSSIISSATSSIGPSTSNSAIITSRCSCLSRNNGTGGQNSFTSIIGSDISRSYNSFGSNIISSVCSSINSGTFSSIQSSCLVSFSGSSLSMIISSLSSGMCVTRMSSLVSSFNSVICSNTNNVSIISGSSSSAIRTKHGSIISSYNGCLDGVSSYVRNASIITGCNSCIRNSACNNTIIGSVCSEIGTSSNSMLIASYNSRISDAFSCFAAIFNSNTSNIAGSNRNISIITSQ